MQAMKATLEPPEEGQADKRSAGDDILETSVAEARCVLRSELPHGRSTLVGLMVRCEHSEEPL